MNFNSFESFNGQDFDFSRWRGRTAVVTGCTFGVGPTICKDLLSAGLKVVGIARRKESADALRSSFLTDFQNRFFAIEADVTDVRSVNDAFDWIQRTLGGVDILINNACFQKPGLLLTMDATTLQRTLQTNIMGVVNCTQRAFRSMKLRNTEGHIFIVDGAFGSAFFEQFGNKFFDPKFFDQQKFFNQMEFFNQQRFLNCPEFFDQQRFLNCPELFDQQRFFNHPEVFGKKFFDQKNFFDQQRFFNQPEFFGQQNFFDRPEFFDQQKFFFNRPEFFDQQRFFNHPEFFGQKFFDQERFFNHPEFFGQKFFDQERFFNHPEFFGKKFFDQQKFFNEPEFFNQRFFDKDNFFGQQSFGQKGFGDKFFNPENFFFGRQFFGHMPFANLFPAVNFALMAVTEMFRQEFKAFGDKIKITFISPGPFNTFAFCDGFKTGRNDSRLFTNTFKDISNGVMFALSTAPGVQVGDLTIKPSIRSTL